MTHDEYVKILKDTLLRQTLKSSFDYIVSKVAFLGWGPIGPIFNFFLKKILTIFIENTELGIYLLYTDFRVARQGSKFSDAATENYYAQLNGTEEEKKIAEDNLIYSFRNLVKLTS